MSKAFDSVHIPLLKKALKRIHIPETITNLLVFLFQNHTNQVITSHGFTDSYKVEDGIDQGETFSLILWRIYYDPLIQRIYTEHEGYRTIIPILLSPKLIHTSVMAYMDDSMWIAHTKEDLSKILNIADSFYHLTNIRVNPTKSVLITNTPTQPNTKHNISYLDTTLDALDSNTPFKYLGAWFSTSNKPTPVQKIINKKIRTCINKLQLAHITEKQAIYIINSVIIPRLS